MALPTRSVVPLSAIRALIPFLRAAPFHPWLASRNPPTYGAASQSGIHPQNHYPLCGDGRESKRVLPPSILGVARIAWPSFRAPNPSMQGTRASPFHPRRCANCRLRIAWSSFRPSSLPASDGRAPRSASPPCKYLICCAQSLADFFLMLPRVLSSLTGFPWRLFQDFTSLNVSDMSAESIRRTQYPSFTDRPSNLRVFSFAELKSATRNFRRGVIKTSDDLNERIEIAVKQLNRKGLQANLSLISPHSVAVCILFLKTFTGCLPKLVKGLPCFIFIENKANHNLSLQGKRRRHGCRFHSLCEHYRHIVDNDDRHCRFHSLCVHQGIGVYVDLAMRFSRFVNNPNLCGPDTTKPCPDAPPFSPPPPYNPTTPMQSPGSSSSTTGAIAGGVVAGAALLFAVPAISFAYWRHRKPQEHFFNVYGFKVSL
ncbi:hypothetical protein ZEAMMB73_Zm00001d032016 [Zea mays]|uniref:Uncharacterized protein n=1 Tax=Zea mays TaxID=4577 RepID=A0A1D6KN30_MAIZE|nr:hypothetical protein ZEAMMB73_Zm00001d032016 [Zea mays]